MNIISFFAQLWCFNLTDSILVIILRPICKFSLSESEQMLIVLVVQYNLSHIFSAAFPDALTMTGLALLWLFYMLRTCGSGALHCSSPTGSMVGRIVVAEDGRHPQDMTTLTWQIGLGETLCYKFNSQKLSGSMEVTFVSLKSVHSIQDSYMFPLVQSSVKCLCDCPGGTSQCSSESNFCNNQTNCANYYNPSVSASGCFFSFLKISAAICCSIQVFLPSSASFIFFSNCL